MSEPSGELTDFPEMDSADLSDAIGTEPPAADPGDDDAATAAGADDGHDDPATDPAADPSAELPAYRREAIAKREQGLQDRIDRLERLIEEQSKPRVEPVVAKPGQTLTPEQQAARESIKAKYFEVFPEAKELFEQAKDILAAAKVAPGMAAQAEAADNHRAESALRTVADTVASRILGQGKTGANLRPEFRRRIATAFAQWTGVDYLDDESKMPPEIRARAVRYQSGDTSLFDEFARDFHSDFTPANRPERVADARRASVKSPRGGPASAPPPAGPKPPASEDEDDLHNAAFRSLRADAAAG